MKRVTPTLVALCLAGCTTQTAPSAATPLEITTATAAGTPVAGARVWSNGRELGRTDEAGKLDVALRRSATLTVLCPPEYRTVVEERRVTLGTGERPGSALQLGFECAPLRQLAALVVRTRGAPPGLPVRARGEVVGHTGEDGVAHLLLEARPATTLRVAIDTASDTTLRPRDPMQTFVLGTADEILLFEQSFERVRARARSRPRPPERTQRAPVPYRIQ